MSTTSENAKTIFLKAVELHAPEVWPEFLDQECNDNWELRGMVEDLLLAHSQKDSLFDRAEATRDYEPLVRPGHMIGPYKIRERIGNGGMGVVYVADQEEPLRRKVALKLIKPGMDTEQVIARFEAERAALALMDHPNIARVLDAGTTEQERPYFVMELIRGAPITEYCDAQRMTIQQRLSLFIQVCRAVQHAHQKGIIHRDIKPNNVLITEQDGDPVPKVIDFGVAKALHQPLTKHSIYSGVFQAIGTLSYMSPEQAGLSASDVDTRADVYGLGVLLYELLTGDTPFGKEELASAALDEACRIIREKEPPKPSDRISTLGEQAAGAGRNRGVDPIGLGRIVQGDLDWIVSKSLEKDRRRRYETADALAADIQNHLSNEPVHARPPSTIYRISRFYRRNKAGVQVAIAVTALVGIGIFLLAAAFHKAETQRQVAQQALARLETELKVRLIQSAMAGREVEAREALAGLQIENQDSWRPFIHGHLAFYNGHTDDALRYFKQALASDAEFTAARMMLAVAYLYSGQSDKFQQALDELPATGIGDPLDELYAIQAGMYGRDNTDVAIAKLEEYFEKHPYTPIARLIRAELLTHRVIFSADLEAARQATIDADVVLEELKGVPTARFIALFAHAYAAKLYESRNMTEQAQSSIVAARDQAELLRESQWVLSHTYRADFYRQVGDSEEEKLAWQKADEIGLKGFLLETYLYYLLENGLQTDVSWETGIKQRSGVVQVMALLRAHDVDERDAAIHSLLATADSNGRIDTFTAAVLGLLGYKDRVSYVRRGLRPEFRATVNNQTSMLEKYLLGEISEAQLLKECSNAGVDDVSFLNVCIAINILGEGADANERRERAKEYLTQANESMSDGWSARVAGAILARLVENSRWPFVDDADRTP